MGPVGTSQHTYKSILDGQIELVTEIKASLLAIRQALLTVNANLGRVITLGFIKAASPDLLGDRASYRPKGKAPIFSIATTRRFLSKQLGWSSRKETKDGQKTPKDWKASCDKTFFRFVYTVRKENIHIMNIMNIDQTGVVLVLGANDATYEMKGAKQVPIHGKDEKRAFAAVLKGKRAPVDFC